ncbi:MAG: hypothetical protein SO455_02080, partial [Alistipes senegalensis]|nr:hypothetical protein [Alistipes senegalensis]
SVEMKDLLFFVHSDHVFELCFHKAKTPISMVPFSMIFLGEFSIAIYNLLFTREIRVKIRVKNCPELGLFCRISMKKAATLFW